MSGLATVARKPPVVIALAIIFCLFFMSTLALVVVPVAATRLGIPDVGIGLILALPGALGLVLDLPAAATSDAAGRKPVLMAGGLSAGLSMLMAAVLLSPVGLVGGMVGYAFGSSLLGVSALALVTEVAADRHSTVQGWNGSVQRLGAVVAGLVAAIGARSYEVALALIGLVALAVAGLASAVHEPDRGPRGVRAGAVASYMNALRMLARSPVRVSSALNLNLNILFIVGTSFLTLYVSRSAGATLATAGVLLAIRDLTAVLTSPLFGPLERRFGWQRVTLPASVGASVCLALTPFVPVPLGLVPLMAVEGLAIGFQVAATNLVVASATTRDERATGLAATGVVGRVGAIAFPIAFAAILSSAGATTLFVTAGVLSVLLLGVYVPVETQTEFSQTRRDGSY